MDMNAVFGDVQRFLRYVCVGEGMSDAFAQMAGCSYGKMCGSSGL